MFVGSSVEQLTSSASSDARMRTLGRMITQENCRNCGRIFLSRQSILRASDPRERCERSPAVAYPTQFSDWNMISSIGGFVYGVSQILFACVIWKYARAGQRAQDRVWDGARGLEWELSSPPPHHSW